MALTWNSGPGFTWGYIGQGVLPLPGGPVENREPIWSASMALRRSLPGRGCVPAEELVQTGRPAPSSGAVFSVLSKYALLNFHYAHFIFIRNPCPHAAIMYPEQA